MDITFLLVLLGAGLLAALAGGGGSGGGSGGTDPDPVDPTPDDITVVSGQKAFGGGGNDILSADGPVDRSEAYGGEGDDTITLTATNSELGGGVGNDLITLSGGTDTVFGGAGNDTLTTGANLSNSNIFGGDGQDALNLDFTTSGNDPASTFSGGDGDDLFHADLTLGANAGANATAPLLKGGNGADGFDLEITLGASQPGSTPQLLATIDDFDPDTDRLQFDAQGATASVVEAANGSYTDLILTYAATASSPAASGFIRLTGVSGLDPADIGLEPNTTPQTFALASHQTVVGGAGDDTFITDALATDTTASGGAGNDLFDVTADFSRLNGDAGNDVITLHGYHSSIFGGAGNDTLTTETNTDYARLFGGSGNDTFNLDYTDFSSAETPASDGGDGADRFNVQLTLNIDPDKAPNPPDLEGGEGSDVFDLDVQLGNVFAPDADTDLERGVATIKDFVPGRDVLQIDGHGAVVSVRDADNGDDTLVVLTYPANGSDPAVSALIILEDITGLTLADLGLT